MAPENGDDFIACVKMYAKPGQCVACVEKESIADNVRQRLTQLIDKTYIVWTGSNVSVAKCESEHLFICVCTMHMRESRWHHLFVRIAQGLFFLFRLHRSTKWTRHRCAAHIERIRGNSKCVVGTRAGDRQFFTHKKSEPYLVGPI